MTTGGGVLGYGRGCRMANNDLSTLGKRLWATADELRANFELKSAEYSVPLFGPTYLGCVVEGSADPGFCRLITFSC